MIAPVRPAWRRALAPAGAAAALALGMAVLFSSQIGHWLLRQGLPREKQLAILPFTNIGDDQNNQALSDGLVETISTKLTRLEQFQGSLWVVPMAEIRRERISSVRQARTSFRATLVLTGSLQRFGGCA